MAVSRCWKAVIFELLMEYKIGELAREFGITLRTLRHYEARGLISPRRTGTTRHYTQSDRERLRQALFAKRIGLPLAEIPAYLDLRQECDPSPCAKGELRQIYEKRLEKLRVGRAEIDETIAEINSRLSTL